MSRSYCPERGDLVWLQFDPRVGSEQSGRRPALVLSHRIYNEKVGLCVVCPVTSRVKGYGFEVALPAASQVKGVVLSDHVRNVDWRARNCEFAEHAPSMVVEDVLAKLEALMY